VGKRLQKVGKSHNNLSNVATSGLSQQSFAHVNEKFGSKTFPSNQERHHSVDSEDGFLEADTGNDQPWSSLVPNWQVYVKKKHQKMGRSRIKQSNVTTRGLSQQSFAHVNEKFGSGTFPSNQERQHSVDSEENFGEEVSERHLQSSFQDENNATNSLKSNDSQDFSNKEDNDEIQDLDLSKQEQDNNGIDRNALLETPLIEASLVPDQEAREDAVMFPIQQAQVVVPETKPPFLATSGGKWLVFGVVLVVSAAVVAGIAVVSMNSSKDDNTNDNSLPTPKPPSNIFDRPTMSMPPAVYTTTPTLPPTTILSGSNAPGSETTLENTTATANLTANSGTPNASTTTAASQQAVIQSPTNKVYIHLQCLLIRSCRILRVPPWKL
jgi:hypothetical protein